MLTGIQLPNHTRPLSALELLRLKALQPGVIRVFDYVTGEQLEQVHQVTGPITCILTHRPAGRVNPAAWTQDFLRTYDTVIRFFPDVWFAPCNEPNHPEGPYQTRDGIEDFKRDYGALVGELDRVWPRVPLVSPNLAVRYGDIEWATACPQLFAFHKYIGVNSYWQYNNALDAEWGMRIVQFRNLFPDKDFVILEMGDSSPDTTSYLKCQRMKGVLAAMRRLGYVAAASIFLLGYDETAPQTWEGFTYRPEDLKALRNDGWDKGALRDLAKGIAGGYGLPFELVDRLIEAESGYNPYAVSRAGAEGLMQLMPLFYPDVNRFEPYQNLHAGCAALSRLLKQMGWDWARTLAAYNWGPGNMYTAEENSAPNWWLWLPEETRNYIRGILYPGR